MSNPLDFFKKEKEPKDLKEILKGFKILEKEVVGLRREVEELKKENKFSAQKIGVVRYNPFSGIGGDQSFSMAILDGNNNGIVITSLYGRDGNRIYAKPIKNNGSEYTLSEEEKRAIEKADKR